MEDDWTRDLKGHKGTFGTVLVIGGADESLSMLGGPVLAGLAAYRVGAGKVVIGLPKTLIHSALELLPEALCFDYLNEHMLSEQIERATSIVIGPGFGQGEHQKPILRKVLEHPKPTIIDADALAMLEDNSSLHTRCILTPHPGELRTLLDSYHVADAHELAALTNTTVIAKDATTVITSVDQTYTHNQPNDKLAIAGSGDVLSGIVGGLYAQFSDKSPFAIAQRAVVVHSDAGTTIKHGALASELADSIHSDQ